MTSLTGKRIVIFTGTLRGGGAERSAVLLAHALLARGHDITLLTLSGTSSDFFPVDPAIRRVGLDLMGENRGLGKIWATVQRIRAIRRMLRTLEADLAIAFMTQESILTILAGLGLRTRVIASERSNPNRDPQPALWRFLRRHVYRFADLHVVQTQVMAEWLRTQTRVTRSVVIANPVVLPLPENAPRVAPADVVPDSVGVILAVGSVPYVKGFDLLVRSFIGGASDMPNWHLVIAGMGDLDQQNDGSFDAVMQEADKVGLASRIHLIGRCGNLGDWYRRADVFVLSSRYEGMPNVLLEAMAHGVASAAFDCPTGPAEIIQNDENGILIPAEDVPALTNALRDLAANEAARRRLGTQAMQVLQNHGVAHIMQEWDNALLRALK